MRSSARGRQEFVDPELESEATVSPAVGAAAMKEGYSGVAIIAPFGCLPGRLIEGVYAPWAKARDYPVLALENDGQPYPPNIVSRIEVFAHNVLRFEPIDQPADGVLARVGGTRAWRCSWISRDVSEPMGEAPARAVSTEHSRGAVLNARHAEKVARVAGAASPQEKHRAPLPAEAGRLPPGPQGS